MGDYEALAKRTQIFTFQNDDGDDVTAAPDHAASTTTSKIYFFRQLQLTIAYMFDTMSAGFLAGYTATLIPELLENDGNEENSFPLDKEQASWIASAAVLPMAPACMLGGLLLEKMGRKRSFFLATSLCTLGWGCIATSYSFTQMIIGRLITGIASGLAGTISPIYIGETSAPQYRGMFTTFAPLGLAIGPLLSHLISLFARWRCTAYIFTILTLLPLIFLINVRESHVWLIKQKRVEQAIAAFYWYRGHNADTQREIEVIVADKLNEQQRDVTSFNMKEIWQRRFLKPLLVTNVLFAAIQWSGNKTVLFYSIDILKRILPTMDELLATLLLDAIRILTAIVAFFLVKMCRVRVLAMWSGLGVAFSLYALPLFIYLSKEAPTSDVYPIMSLLSLLAFLTFVSIGLNPLPWVIYSEIFPQNTKGAGGALSVYMYFVMYFCVIKVSPTLFEQTGIGGTFSIFATITLFFTCVLYFILPETKNRTLKEIEAFFINK